MYVLSNIEMFRCHVGLEEGNRGLQLVSFRSIARLVILLEQINNYDYTNVITLLYQFCIFYHSSVFLLVWLICVNGRNKSYDSHNSIDR